MTLDDYEVVAQISNGIMSTLFRARPKSAINGRVYDYVMLKRLNLVKPELHDEFLSQAQQLTFISLPSNFSMVHILSHFIHDETCYLVMDDIGEAKSLRQVVDARAAHSSSSDPNDQDEYLTVLHAKEITYLCHQMISLLAMIHSQSPSIRHGDIRPETIFQFSDPTISTAQFKLANFGNSLANNDIHALTSGKVDMSECLYMSPEHVTSSQTSSVTMTTASDIWSLGAAILNLSLGFDLSTLLNSETTKNRFANGTWSFDEDLLGKLDDIQMELWTQQSGLSQLTMRTCLRCCAEDRPAAADIMLMPTYFEALQERHKDIHDENQALKDMIEALEMRLRDAMSSELPPPSTTTNDGNDGDEVTMPPVPM
jgi:serine/threonine protein kinase